MQFGSTIKRIAALGSGVVMMGATITGAMAYTLADYPAPFVMGGAYDLLPVYGDIAMADDIAGAWDILGGLAVAVSSGAGTAGGRVIAVSGGETEDIPLGLKIANETYGFDVSLEDDDISTLQDSEVAFSGGSYDFHDEIELGTVNATSTDPNRAGSAEIMTSLTSSDDDYETSVYMEIPRGSLGYYYLFDEVINMNSTSTSSPLKINFLGKTLKIISIVDGDTFKAYVGDEYFMNVGDSVTVEGKTATLQNVGQTAVVVNVDGVQETITNGETEVVNGVEITVDELFYRTQIEQSSATLVVGIDSSEEIDDGDMYFGGDKNCANNDPDDADCWSWVVSELQSKAAGDIRSKSGISGDGPTIGLKNEFVINDDKDNPPTIGDCISFPNKYVQMCMDSLTVPDTNYVTYRVSYQSDLDLSDDGGNASTPGIMLESVGLSEGFVIRDGVMQGDVLTKDTKTDTIYLVCCADTSATATGELMVFYEDPDTENLIKHAGNVSLGGTTDGADDFDMNETLFYVNYDRTTGTTGARVEIQMDGAINHSNSVQLLVIPTGKDWIGPARGTSGVAWGQTAGTGGLDTIGIYINHLANNSIQGLGATAALAEAADVRWGTNERNLGTKDEDHRSAYGIIVRDPDSTLDGDMVELEIPSDQVQANVVIKGATSVVSAVTSAGMGGTAIAPPMVKDVEVTNPAADNLVLIGGPVVNRLTAQFIGSSWAYRPGEAIIEMKDNGANVAMVVAGTDAVDTRRAARVLRDYGIWQSRGSLAGRVVKVTGTSAAFTDTVVSPA